MVSQFGLPFLRYMLKEAEELEVKDAVQLSSTGAKSLMDSEEYKTQEFVSQYLLAMKNKMLTAVAEVKAYDKTYLHCGGRLLTSGTICALFHVSDKNFFENRERVGVFLVSELFGLCKRK